MKNKALKTIINVIIGIVCVALFVWLYVGMDEEFFPSILYAVLGVLAFYLINAIVHELAHVTLTLTTLHLQPLGNLRLFVFAC